MRLSILIAAAATALAPVARACDLPVSTCLPAVVAFPAYTPEGLRIGTVEAPVRRLPPLEPSRFTGQPLTVVYNTPGSLPGAIDPSVALVPLPRAKAFRTQAVYPRGY